MKNLEKQITAAAPELGRSASSPGDGERVLIVEDEPRNQLILRDYLEHMGLESDIAGTGVEGLEKAREQVYDLVLLDIMMPGMNGYEVLKHLKLDDSTRHLPVIVISALDSVESTVRCIELGAEDSLPKPFKRPLLRARLEACLERKRLRDREREMQVKDRQQLQTIQRNYEQLRITERSRDNLSNMIVHDLNSPLNAILGYSDLIRIHLEDGVEPSTRSDILPCLDQVSAAVKRMVNLTASILDVAKLENGSLPVRKTKLDLVALAQQFHHRFQELAKQQGMNLELDVVGQPLHINADETLLQRVIENLVSNSLKYGSEHACIRVACHPAGKPILEVVNDGHVISSSDQKRVFDKYYQCEGKDGKIHQRYGVGLGLTFCKLATEAMGARIWTDRGSDEQTHFYVEFDLPIPDDGLMPVE